MNPANEPVGKWILSVLGGRVYFAHIIVGTVLGHRDKHAGEFPAQLHDGLHASHVFHLFVMLMQCPKFRINGDHLKHGDKEDFSQSRSPSLRDFHLAFVEA